MFLCIEAQGGVDAKMIFSLSKDLISGQVIIIALAGLISRAITLNTSYD